MVHTQFHLVDKNIIRILEIKKMKEVWKDFDKKYEVSSIGRVRTKENTVITKDGKKFFYKSHLLTQTMNNSGYYKVRLYEKWHYVHRLVAMTFLDNEKKQVNHIDGNKLNNNANNLQWVTQSQNMKHAYDSGLLVPYDRKGEKNPNYKHGKRVKI